MAATDDADAEHHDEVAELRDGMAALRNRDAESRDALAAARRKDAERRDEQAEGRDQAAERRDEAAAQAEVRSAHQQASDAFITAAGARRDGAADRRMSRHDRDRAAAERDDADLDRYHSAGDRSASDDERTLAKLDRGRSYSDRLAASLDGLTGAYLRGPGLLQLERDFSRSRRTGLPFVLAFVDIDRLKSVNDAGGHAAGDSLLVNLATALKAKLRPYDVIIRFGGDEFVCGLAGLDLAGASERMQLVHTALTESSETGSITVGLAELGPDESLESLIRRADTALYDQRELHRSHEQP